MKTLKITFVLAIISCLTFSCSGDDAASTEENKAKIIGTWLLTSETENGVAQPLGDCKTTIVITSTQIKITISGQNCSETGTATQNYTIDGNTISLTGEGGGAYQATIVSISSTTLVIKQVDEENGMTETNIGTYTKQ